MNEELLNEIRLRLMRLQHVLATIQTSTNAILDLLNALQSEINWYEQILKQFENCQKE